MNEEFSHSRAEIEAILIGEAQSRALTPDDLVLHIWAEAPYIRFEEIFAPLLEQGVPAQKIKSQLKLKQDMEFTF
jgi:hypothetical protein